MKEIYLVLSNNGDGSNSIWWFIDSTIEQLLQLEENDMDQWGSGDGLQYKRILIQDFEQFKKDNPNICFYTYDEYINDYE